MAVQSYRAEGAPASSTATENHDVHHLVHNHTPTHRGASVPPPVIGDIGGRNAPPYVVG